MFLKYSQQSDYSKLIWKDFSFAVVYQYSASICTVFCISIYLHCLLYYWASVVAQTVNICLQCRRPGFDPCIRKISWRRKLQPTSVSLPEKSHGRRSLVGYSPWGLKESDTTERSDFLFTFCISGAGKLNAISSKSLSY